MRLSRLALAVVVWVGAVGSSRAMIALPERCPPVAGEEARAAAREAVAWFERNQRPDGRWVYRYDRHRDLADLRSHLVRHSGVTMSLYQAHAAGHTAALEVADRGAAWSLDHLVRHDDWAAVGLDAAVPTGATALLVAGLSVRRAETGDPRFDDDLAAMGRFLVEMTQPSGAVLATWSTTTRRPVPNEYSKYFTGETLFALSLLATVEPDGEWHPAARRILHYLATDRDRAEGLFPPTPDHWAAYGLTQLAVELGVDLSSEEEAYARRLAALFGVEVRYESQRTGAGLNLRALRGPRTLGAGLGTLGEGLGSLWRAAPRIPGLSGQRAVIGERLRCTAGMLTDRQVDREEAATAARPGLARGAWFRAAVTQMDDQQHALSALLLAGASLERGGVDGGPSGDDRPGRVVWLAAVAFLAVNPVRARRMVDGVPARAVLAGALGASIVLGILALGSGPIVRLIDVSPPTALVAAGIAVGVSAIVDLVRRLPAPLPATVGRGAVVPVAFPPVVTPAATLVVLSVAADIGVVPGALVGLAASVAVLGALVPTHDPPSAAETVAARLLAAAAVVGAVDLVIDGVLAV